VSLNDVKLVFPNGNKQLVRLPGIPGVGDYVNVPNGAEAPYRYLVLHREWLADPNEPAVLCGVRPADARSPS
jgi:hypothetical protein